MPHFTNINPETHSFTTRKWMEPCLESNYTRGIRMSVNETHWVLETGHILMEKDESNNGTTREYPGTKIGHVVDIKFWGRTALRTVLVLNAVRRKAQLWLPAH